MSEFPEEMLNVPILAKVWHEDGVWNVSAFDVPIVAYGDDIETARANFEEAIACHFKALKHFNELDQAISDLRQRATQMGFYPERVQPRDLVQNFAFARRELSLAY